MSGLSSYTTNKVLDAIFRGQPFTTPSTLYVALLLDDTVGGNEVSGGGYARVAITPSLDAFSGTQAAGSTTPSSGTSGLTSNNIVIEFPAPTGNWGLVAKAWIYDASTGGNMIAKGVLATPKYISSGDPAPLFTIGSLAIQLLDGTP